MSIFEYDEAQHLRNVYEDGYKEGFIEGYIEEIAKATIRFKLDINRSRHETAEYIMKEFSLDPKQAEEYLDKYWPEGKKSVSENHRTQVKYVSIFEYNEAEHLHNTYEDGVNYGLKEGAIEEAIELNHDINRSRKETAEYIMKKFSLDPEQVSSSRIFEPESAH